MNDKDTEHCLLYLVAPTDVEAIIVDWLIESELVKGFSSVPISGHSADYSALSIAEQVEGRRWMILYLIRLPQSSVDTVLNGLRNDLGHIGIDYWVVPVTAYGKII